MHSEVNAGDPGDDLEDADDIKYIFHEVILLG
jgi:hypothetical protein